MKKNIAMRVAAILFILTMISTCAFSTTFAKYITTDETQDTARVAHWGVKVSVQGEDAFATEYDADEADKTVVSSESTINVVAPGTSGQLVSIKITGKPEVDSKITFTVTNVAGTGDAEDVFLGAGFYNDYTTTGATDSDQPEFIIASGNDYHPIVFTVKKNGVAVADKDTLAEVEEYLEAETKNYNANETLDVEYTVDWAWAFTGQNDKADTYLGNLIAGTDTTTNSYSLNISFKLNVLVEQIGD